MLAFVTASLEEAPGQCMWWDSSVGLVGPSTSYDLRVFDGGSGPELFCTYGWTVRRWTGTSWVLAGNSGFDDEVMCLGSYGGGGGPYLYVGGQFRHTALGLNVDRLAILVYGGWVGLGIPASPGGSVRALQDFDDGQGRKLYVGGMFSTYSSYGSPSLVTWNGATWSGVGGGLTGVPPNSPFVTAMCVFDDGTGPALYVGGVFLAAGGVTVNHIAKWNGTSWSPLGSGLSYSTPAYAGATAMTVFDDGTEPALYVAGIFDHAGGVPADGIARWDGANWSALPGIYGTPSLGVQAVKRHDDGSGPALYIGFNSPAYIGQSEVRGVARWDGQAWSSLGGGFGGYVYALESFDDGQGGGPALWVGGNNGGSVGGNLPPVDIARWYGACTHGVDRMCYGDGTFAPCPCANYGWSFHGCANSVSSQGALLSATGTTNPDALMLQSAPEPPTCISIFLQSSTLLPLQLSFGDGILCLGGQIRRLYVKTASGVVVQAPQLGDPSITQVSASLGDPIAPGSVRYYQVWYRDGEPTFCPPASFNISNGLRVVW